MKKFLAITILFFLAATQNIKAETIPNLIGTWSGENNTFSELKGMKTWEKNVKTEVSNFLNGVHIQSKDPESMMRSWERALGKEAVFQDNQFQIQLEESRIVFIEDSDGRGEGIESFEISVKDKESLLKKAEEKDVFSCLQILQKNEE